MSAFLSSKPFGNNLMHFKIIVCYLNVFFVQLQLKEQNLKSVIWAPEIGLSKQSKYVPAHIG